MKKITAIIIFSICAILVVGLVLFNSNIYDTKCLEGYAESYCKSQNETYYDVLLGGENSRIRCDNINRNPRAITEPILKVYKFLPEEIENCTYKLIRGK
jgi:hypothetical protein